MPFACWTTPRSDTSVRNRRVSLSAPGAEAVTARSDHWSQGRGSTVRQREGRVEKSRGRTQGEPLPQNSRPLADGSSRTRGMWSDACSGPRMGQRSNRTNRRRERSCSLASRPSSARNAKGISSARGGWFTGDPRSGTSRNRLLGSPRCRGRVCLARLRGTRGKTGSGQHGGQDRHGIVRAQFQLRRVSRLTRSGPASP